jgi:hypothetical protein
MTRDHNDEAGNKSRGNMDPCRTARWAYMTDDPIHEGRGICKGLQGSCHAFKQW